MLWRGRLTPPNMVADGSRDDETDLLCVPNRISEQAPERPFGGSGEAALDTTAKSVGRFEAENSRKQGRNDRFRWQRHAAGLLGGKARVGLCRWSMVSRAAGVDVVTSTYEGSESRFAHYEGLQTCGSVWDCPCCSARISSTRRDELNRLLSWARAQGHTVQMITLTARHGREDDLADLLERMKEAKRRWAQHRAHRRLKPAIVGSVTATEVTGGGANGWHPHFHMIIVTAEAVDLDELREPWLASLRASGLDGTGAGWRVQDASQAGRYVAKWGAAEEVAFGARKKGRGGLTPMQLLAASCDNDDGRAGALWREYSAAFRGRRQLVWSRGLKALAGIGEIEDQEAAQDERQDGQQEDARVKIEAEDWSPRDRIRRGAQHRRARILDAAEADGEAGVRRVVSETGTDNAHDLNQVIEVPDTQRWQPIPGGLASVLMATISPPGFSGGACKMTPEKGVDHG